MMYPTTCVTVMGNSIKFEKNEAVNVVDFEELKSKKCGEVISKL